MEPDTKTVATYLQIMVDKTSYESPIRQILEKTIEEVKSLDCMDFVFDDDVSCMDMWLNEDGELTNRDI
jgi:hypothetical protein